MPYFLAVFLVVFLAVFHLFSQLLLDSRLSAIETLQSEAIYQDARIRGYTHSHTRTTHQHTLTISIQIHTHNGNIQADTHFIIKSKKLSKFQPAADSFRTYFAHIFPIHIFLSFFPTYYPSAPPLDFPPPPPMCVCVCV